MDNWLDQGKGVWVSMGGKMWEGKHMGIENKGYLVRFLHADLSQCYLHL